MQVDIVTSGARHSIPLWLLRDAALTAMRATRCPRGTRVEIALVDDATISRINRRFLGQRRPTDVLAFPGETTPRGRRGSRGRSVPPAPPLGEILISLERARAQARDAGWPVRQEVVLLLVHGLLHLRGYDDCTPGEARLMRTHERRILARIFGKRR